MKTITILFSLLLSNLAFGQMQKTGKISVHVDNLPPEEGMAYFAFFAEVNFRK